MDYWINRCKTIFGNQWNLPDLQKKNSVMNSEFGGVKSNVTNMLLFNGELDPWTLVSYREPIKNENITVKIVPGEGHCPDLTNYKNLIREKLHLWTQKYIPHGHKLTNPIYPKFIIPYQRFWPYFYA